MIDLPTIDSQPYHAPIHLHRDHFSSKGFSYTLANIIKIHPEEAQPDEEEITLGYDLLICTEEDRARITELILKMGEHGKMWLLFHQGDMKKLGDSVRHVHPLRFLEVVFTNPSLVQAMNEVFNDYFKRNGFMDGLGPNMTKHAERGTLHQYRETFEERVSLSKGQLEPYFEKREWEDMLRFLMSL